MRWLRNMNHRDETDALNQFWDEVVRAESRDSADSRSDTR